MASILFVPVCSKCHRLINGPVGNDRSDFYYKDDLYTTEYPQSHITPTKCPSCGCNFTRWLIPDYKQLMDHTIDIVKVYNENYYGMDEEVTDET